MRLLTKRELVAKKYVRCDVKMWQVGSRGYIHGSQGSTPAPAIKGLDEFTGSSGTKRVKVKGTKYLRVDNVSALDRGVVYNK